METKIREVKPEARILHCVKGQTPLPLISRLGLKYIDDYLHYLEDGIVSLVTFESERPFTLGKFEYFLENQLPHNVFKAIGVLWFDENPKCHSVYFSGTRGTIFGSYEWKDQPKNQMVLIGQNLDAECLKSQLKKCMAE